MSSGNQHRIPITSDDGIEELLDEGTLTLSQYNALGEGGQAELLKQEYGDIRRAPQITDENGGRHTTKTHPGSSGTSA